MVKVFQNLNWALSHFCSLVIQLVCEVSRHSNHILIYFPSPAPGETKIKRASCMLMSTMNHLYHSDWIIYGVSDWTRLGFIASPSLVPHGPELQGKPAFIPILIFVTRCLPLFFYLLLFAKQPLNIRNSSSFWPIRRARGRPCLLFPASLA